MQLIFNDEVLSTEMADPTLDSKRQQLLAKIGDVYKAYGDYIRETTAIVVGSLEEQWEAAKEAARNKREEIERFRNAWDASVLAAKNADANVENCQARLANINRDKPKEATYPSKKTLAEYEDKLQRANAALDRAISAQQDITSYSQWKQRETQLNAEMSKLAEDELNLRLKLQKHKPTEVRSLNPATHLQNEFGLGMAVDERL